MDRTPSQSRGPVERAIALGEEALCSTQPPITDDTLERLEALMAERESALQQAMEATAADPGANGLDPQTLRQLATQQRALEEQFRRVMSSMQEASGEAQEARSSMQAVNRILNPGVPSRMIDERR